METALAGVIRVRRVRGVAGVRPVGRPKNVEKDRLFFPLGMEPEQWAEREKAATGELAIMAAILSRSLDDVASDLRRFEIFGVTTGKGEEAIAWMKDVRDHLYSYESVCSYLGVGPRRLKAAVLGAWNREDVRMARLIANWAADVAIAIGPGAPKRYSRI